MDTFTPGTNITLTFDMIDDRTAEVIDPASATFDVFDDEGVQLVTAQAVTVTGGETSLDVTVQAAENTISGTEGARSVVLNILTTSGDARQLVKTYLLTSHSVLAVPSESGMNLLQSEMVANKMAQSVLEVWADEDIYRKSAALREAWSRLSRIPFTPWRNFEDIPSGTDKKLIEGDFQLNLLSPTEWASLPETFRKALQRAQIIEAAVILDGDPTWDRRQDGLISKTVGESSEMFASRKAAFSTVSPKAHREISGYIRRRISLGRA